MPLSYVVQLQKFEKGLQNNLYRVEYFSLIFFYIFSNVAFF